VCGEATARLLIDLLHVMLSRDEMAIGGLAVCADSEATPRLHIDLLSLMLSTSATATPMRASNCTHGVADAGPTEQNVPRGQATR
jgi:hypothetical protein